VTLTNCTIAGNFATGGNGARGGSGGSGFGGGIFSLNGSITMTYDTIADNTCTAGAGTGATLGTADGLGVYTMADDLTVSLGSTNTSVPAQAAMTVNNSIIADNVGVVGAGTGRFDLTQNASDFGSSPPDNAVITGLQNLVPTVAAHNGNGKTLLNSGTLINGFGPPILGPLQNNGGQALTIALAPNSPGAGAADRNVAGLPAIDERALPRPTITQGPLDIGAYQNQYTVNSISTFTGTYNPSSGTPITLQDHVNSFGLPVPQGTVVFTVAGQTMSAPVISGMAQISFTMPPSVLPGSYIVTAAYTDTATPSIYSPSSSQATLTIPAILTHTTVTSTSTKYSLFSQTDTITAQVTDVLGIPITSGTMTFTDHGQAVNATISNGVATGVITFSFFNEVPGAHPVTAMFNGNSEFGSSTGTGAVLDSSFGWYFQYLFLLALLGY
jgi:hypothetical protein